MAQHEEPMDIDSSVCDFDNKENAFQHSNVLARTPCTEKGYEELDVSELTMKLKYSTTPSLSPMSKSYTANCIDNRSFDSGNNIVDNDGNLSRSMNSAVTKNDSVVRYQMCLPLQTIPVEQGHTDTNRNALRPLDSTVTLDNNVVIAVSTPNETDENLSLPSSSSSIVHTPEATTPNKEELTDGGSPIMRGLKSVINMFRPSQSPIPLVEPEIVPVGTETLSPPIVLSPEYTTEKSQAVLASTPLSSQKTKDALIKRHSPNRESLVFNDDLENELQWKDETTIIFNKEKIPIHKLFFQTGKSFEIKADKENLDNTVEYMDISYNNSTNKILDDQPQSLPVNIIDAVASESEGEFVDCESTFTKNESPDDLNIESQENVSDSNTFVSFDWNVPICGDQLNNIKATLNVTTASVKSNDQSVVSTETVNDATGENMQTNYNDKVNEGVSSLEIKNDSCAQVYSKQSSLPLNIALKQVVPNVPTNINITLGQNNTFNIENTFKKDCADSNAQVDSNTENRIPFVTNINENVLNSISGISSLSQIPLISDPRVLLFNVSSEDIPNTQSVYLENTVAKEKIINVDQDTTPADIPLPDDDDIEKVSLEDVINKKCGDTELVSQGEIKIPLLNVSGSRFDDEESLHIKKPYCNKLEQDSLDKIQVSTEVANVIESAIIAVQHIIDGTESQDGEPININESINAAHICSDLNETDNTLTAIETRVNEIASIPQREVISINSEIAEAEVAQDETSDITVLVVEELQKIIEKLEDKEEISTTLDETRIETKSFVAMNGSKNATESTDKVEGNSKQNQDNLISVLPVTLASGEFKLSNSAKFVPPSEFIVATPHIIDNIVSKEQISLGDKIELGDKVVHHEPKTETFVKMTESNILVENKDYVMQNVAISVCVTDNAAMKLNDPVEVDITKNKLTVNAEIITATDETTDTSMQMTGPVVNILSSVVTTAPITNVAEIKTEKFAVSEELNLNKECVVETVQNYHNNNEASVPADKLADSLTSNLKADYDDTMDEEIVASANNSPFVSVSANFEEVLEDKPVELFENVCVPVETNEECKIYRPSSPHIVTKGYNFNFDDIEDPFATKTKIRISPPLDVTLNQSFDQTNDTDIGKRLPTNKDFSKEKRKSQPLRKKPSTTNKKINATSSGSSKESIEKAFAKPKPQANKISEKEITPINKKFQPTIDSMEIDGTLCMPQNTSAALKDVGVTKKALPYKVEDEVSINVNLTKEICKTEKDCIIEKSIESEEQSEFNPSADSATTVAEEIKNTSNSEQSAFYSEGTSSSEGRLPKSSYNIPEINDTNFNPFASKSKVRQSPPPSLDNSFASKSKLRSSPDSYFLVTKETCTDDGSIKKSSHDEENDSSNSVNNITCSSKKTDKVNTEDEDTIEGPFLETEDLAVDSKISESESKILINNKKIIDISGGFHGDMMQFSEISTSDEGIADAGELFIDADAFEFLLNQNQNNAVADKGRESLFLKFDPLFAKRVSSDGVITALKNIHKRHSTPQKTAPTQSAATFIAKSPAPEPFSLNVTNELGVHDTTEESIDDLNITIAKPMMVVNPAVTPVVTPRTKINTPVASNRRSLTFTSPAIAVIDRLLSLSATNSAIAHETTIPEASRDQNEAGHALTQLRELLADKEINVYALRSEAKELKDRLFDMESQIKSLETVSEERLKNINELTEKLDEKTKHNKSMAKVVEEYERMIASLIAEKEQDKKMYADERIQLIRERDEQVAHLASMEVSFSDLHSKYEKSKQTILGFKTNEEIYKKSNKEFEDNLAKTQNNYELLKQHATSKLNHANEELHEIHRAHEAEVLKLKAMIKRKELHITSLEETVSQKSKANEELTAICDELINKVSSR